jgi:o-succinylbenzoate synthase
MHITWAPFSLPLRAPVSTARTTHSLRRGFLVRIHDEGRVGVGEATPLPSQGTESLAECEAALGSVLRALKGLSLPSVGDLDSALGALSGAPAARFAVEQALLDLHSQREGVSLARLLAPDAAQRVAVNALLIESSPEALAVEATQRRAQGFRDFKVKVGADLDADDARLAAVRAAIGGASLRIDANGGWSVAQAEEALSRFEVHGVSLCEQPVATAAELEQLSTFTVIAADECLAVPAERERVLASRSVSLLVLKPMVLGGLRPALALAARARACDLEVIVTTTIDGAVARAGATALACALGGPLAHGLATGALLERDVAQNDPSGPQDGFCTARQEPGLGLVLDPELAWSTP